MAAMRVQPVKFANIFFLLYDELHTSAESCESQEHRTVLRSVHFGFFLEQWKIEVMSDSHSPRNVQSRDSWTLTND